MDWQWSTPAEGSISCPLCHQPGCFPSAERLLHALRALASGPSCCGICGTQLADLPSYLQHLARHLSPALHTAPRPAADRSSAPVSPSAALSCPHCSRTFKTARGRTSHMRAKHASETEPAAEGSPAGGPLRSAPSLVPTDPRGGLPRGAVSVTAGRPPQAAGSSSRLQGTVADRSSLGPTLGAVTSLLPPPPTTAAVGPLQPPTTATVGPLQSQISATVGSLQPPITAAVGPLQPPITAAVGPLQPPISAAVGPLQPPITAAVGLIALMNDTGGPPQPFTVPTGPSASSRLTTVTSGLHLTLSCTTSRPVPPPTAAAGGLLSPGAGTRGLLSPGTGTRGLLSPGAAGTRGLLSPGTGTRGLLSPGAAGTSGLLSPGAAGTSGLLSPGAAGTSGAVSPPALQLARRGDGSRRLRRLLQASHACQDCGRVFRLRPGLAAHRRLAHGDGACEQCAVCQRRFTSGRRLQRHLAAAHGLTGTDHAPSTDDKTKESSAHECPTCKKTFTTAQFLKKHMKLHTGETPYVCEVCGRAFSLQQSYHKHQQYHTAVRPYTCPQCGRAFRESATLQNHMRIHSGEKPWTCETCGKSFRQRITYVVHRRIHTGALPYTCELCHSGFRYKLNACGG
ncbi:zinc finger and BTB domain-containing protein 16-like [Amphibalanus amphitrite]|uniref:zinc finger and BTB domain-containing protein 16-like n=1 Tax=Amphibalanus amphitrite TaxID=1232801 RepID=UPI001C9061C0|nr:zinc finger and BTB domain-containing protein 16-like [Amphibalanus amphitrite]